MDYCWIGNGESYLDVLTNRTMNMARMVLHLVSSREMPTLERNYVYIIHSKFIILMLCSIS